MGASHGHAQMFLRQLLDSLAVLRDAGIIHCDLKPENILLMSPQVCVCVCMLVYLCAHVPRVYAYAEACACMCVCDHAVQECITGLPACHTDLRCSPPLFVHKAVCLSLSRLLPVPVLPYYLLCLALPCLCLALPCLACALLVPLCLCLALALLATCLGLPVLVPCQ